MEGVGSRLGRSSTRYGVTGSSPAVFSGPVRKWKKKWVHIKPPPHKPNSKPNSNPKFHNSLSLFKWTKTSQQQQLEQQQKEEQHDVDDEIEEDPPRRKFRYIPIAKLEEQKQEAEYNIFGDQFKPNKTSFNTPMSKSDKAASEENPDINDVPMYENQGRGGKIARHDLNEGTFDLSLG